MSSAILLNGIGNSRPLSAGSFRKQRPTFRRLRARSNEGGDSKVDLGHTVSKWAKDAGLKTDTTWEDFLGDR